MTPRMIRVGLALSLGMVLCTQEAMAWGPKARQAIVETTLQVIQRDFPLAFQQGEANVEGDVIAGAEAGTKQLGDSVPLANEDQAVIAVENQIQLLRAARKYGISTYFAYRMGVLCALVSDMSLPYSMGFTPSDTVMKHAIDADIEKHVAQYRYAPTPEQDRQRYMRNPGEYFRRQHEFFGDARQMIALDYRGGSGYGGYLLHGGPAFFANAIQASADAWYTVLRLRGDPSDVAPSSTAMTWYFVNEIGYLLNVKKSVSKAEKVYANFERVNPGLAVAYEKVGDLFYQAGSQKRGVAEWVKALSYPGEQRARVSQKLSNHYYELGSSLLEKGKDIHSPEDTLDNAQRALEQALAYAGNNQAIADKLKETKRLLAAKDERRKTSVSIIAAADKVMGQAAQKSTAGDYANAIATYNSAASLYEAIDEEFPEQYKAAKDGIAEVKKQINKIIVEVLDRAQDQIDQGQKAVREKKFDEAITDFSSVPNIVSVVPADESTTNGKERLKRINDANRLLKAAKEQKTREEQMQQAAAQRRPN